MPQRMLNNPFPLCSDESGVTTRSNIVSPRALDPRSGCMAGSGWHESTAIYR